MEEILNKIKEHRKKKGFSYENMANELNLSIAAYRKIELNQTKLTVEKLLKISEILDTKVDEIMGIESNKQQNQSNFENSIWLSTTN
jgi:transcriptional regulator with XRE-family HTH domain